MALPFGLCRQLLCELTSYPGETGTDLRFFEMWLYCVAMFEKFLRCCTGITFPPSVLSAGRLGNSASLVMQLLGPVFPLGTLRLASKNDRLSKDIYSLINFCLSNSGHCRSHDE